MDWRLLVKERIAKIAKLRTPCFFKGKKQTGIWREKKWETSQLCILGELAKGGSVAVAVAVAGDI